MTTSDIKTTRGNPITHGAKRHGSPRYGIGISLIATAGLFDMLTGLGSYSSLFYLVPVILFAWLRGGISVAVISLCSALMCSAADMTAGHVYSRLAVPLWNFLAVLTMLLIAGYATAYMKKIIRPELTSPP